MRWLGVAYLLYLAARLIRSALRAGLAAPTPPTGRRVVAQGFLTSFLNPKGLLTFVFVLPQFVDPAGGVALEAAVLSATFVALCGLVYGLAGWGAARLSRGRAVSNRRRAVEGGAGGLLVVAAGAMALS